MSAAGPDPTQIEKLRAALGDQVSEAVPLEVDGASLDVRVRPDDVAALSSGLRTLADLGLGAVVRGSGRRQALGNPPRGPCVALSTERIAGLVELDAAEGVLCARAGTPLGELRDAVRDVGWELPFDPPGDGTLGGVLAAAARGPRHLGWGVPRDLVLGLDVVSGDGVRTSCGGRVVKNVTGYDLIKLHVGGLGTLGVIASAWLRLRPQPEAVRVVSVALGEHDDAGVLGVAAARLASARAVALVDASLAPAVEPMRAMPRGALLVAELAGAEEVVAADAERLGAEAASPGALVRLRALQGESFGPIGLRFRLSVLPSRLDRVVSELRSGWAGTLVYPGSGLVFARFSVDLEVDAAGADLAWRAVAAAARAGGGHAVLETGPRWAKEGRDVFGELPDGIGIMRALKRRFDPAGVLNPGRFAGGI